jgi:hypothetical protein
MSLNQRRGTAIAKTDKGILVVSGRSKLFITPGGGSSKKESRMQSAKKLAKKQTESAIK